VQPGAGRYPAPAPRKPRTFVSSSTRGRNASLKCDRLYSHTAAAAAERNSVRRLQLAVRLVTLASSSVAACR
jgi:hypothetical protein